jgi:hypothetical protein
MVTTSDARVVEFVSEVALLGPVYFVSEDALLGPAYFVSENFVGLVVAVLAVDSLELSRSDSPDS